MSVQSDESTPKRQETEPVNGAQPESADDLERLRAELAEIEQKADEDAKRIPAEGAEFDPREHEALGRQPSPDVPEGHVLHVVRQGYKKGDRVIRPAQVIIASRPE